MIGGIGGEFSRQRGVIAGERERGGAGNYRRVHGKQLHFVRYCASDIRERERERGVRSSSWDMERSRRTDDHGQRDSSLPSQQDLFVGP